jgi:leucine-rich repeat protein SHOC2
MKRIIIALILINGLFSCYNPRMTNKEYSQYKIYTNLNKALKNTNQVKILRLSSKDLKEFPLEITELQNLKVLILTNNQISLIPAEISRLKNLERLDLMGNNLKELPLEIVQLKKLKRINLAYNDVNEDDVKFIKDSLPEVLIITEIIL